MPYEAIKIDKGKLHLCSDSGKWALSGQISFMKPFGTLSAESIAKAITDTH